MKTSDSSRYKQEIDSLDDNSSHKKIIEAIPHGATVLDVGCACGDIGVYLHKHKKCTMYGLEYCEESAAAAKSSGAYAEVYQADLNNFDPQKQFSHIQFDRIIYGDILEHLYSPTQVIADFATLLKPNGKIVVSLPNIGHASIVLQLLSNKFEYMKYGILDDTHIRFFTYKSIAALFADISFCIESAGHVIYNIHGLHKKDTTQSPSKSTLSTITQNPHAFVLQYVFVASVQPPGAMPIVQHNEHTLGKFSSDAQKLITHFQNEFDVSVNMNGYVTFQESAFEKVFFQHIKPFVRNILPRQVWNAMKTVRNFWRRAKIRFTAKHCQSEYVTQILSIPNDEYDNFVPLAQQPVVPALGAPKAIAFYLPQFHSFPENDKWWGRGFTEWTNVAKAVPQFVNHYQPRLPIDVGYYDLKVPEVMHRQVELAKFYGISGFCFHYYWFSGKKIMNLPVDRFLTDTTLDFPFCFCWANEPWTRRWDGSENEVLISQDHLESDDQRFVEDMHNFFKDSRYITVDEKPLLIIYRPHLWSRERVLRLTDTMRKTAHHLGHKGLYLVAALSHDFFDNPETWGFDSGIEFPPHLCGRTPTMDVDFINKKFSGSVHNMQALVASAIKQEYPFQVFKTVFPNWDNTARKNSNAFIFHNCSPSLYKQWLSAALTYAYTHNSPSSRMVFINAWNEWAEGAYLEPDRKFGYAYLQATADALASFSEKTS